MIGQRRSRAKRQSSGRALEIGPRDRAIFAALSHYRYLPSTYLHAFAGGASETRFKERLGDLFHERYLDRPEAQWRLAGCRHSPAIYELGDGARQALAAEGWQDGSPYTHVGTRAKLQFPHSLFACELLSSIELAAHAALSLRFVPWPEILAKAPAETKQSATPLTLPLGHGRYLIPDALFGLEYTLGNRTSYRFCALEADCGTMPITRSNEAQSSLRAKMLQYRSAIAASAHRRHWGIPNLLVLLVTQTPARASHCLSMLPELPEVAQATLVWSTPDNFSCRFPARELLITPWLRAGNAPVHLDRP